MKCRWIRNPRSKAASLLAAALFAATASAANAADPRLESGRNQWINRQYPPARSILLGYRQAANARTPQIDYMLGTSGCRIAGQRGWGASVLDFALYRYQLTASSRRIIEREKNLCRSASAMPVLAGQALDVAVGAHAGATSRGKGMIRLDTERPVNAFPARSIGTLDEATLDRRLVGLGSSATVSNELKALAPDGARVVVIGRYAFVTAAGHSNAQLAVIAARLDRYLAFLNSEFGIRLPDTYLTLYLVRTQPDLSAVARRVHLLEVDATTIGYSFQGDQSAVAIIPGTQIGTLFHELLHLVIRNSFGDAPQWLDEGIAALYEVSEFDGARLEGRPNWRGPLLRTLWEQRPTLEQLIAAEWFASDTPGIPGSDVPEPLADDQARLTETIAVQHATARYFMLYLQQSGKLRDVFAAVQRLQPGDGDDPRQAAIAAVAAQTGPLDALQKRFDDWFTTTDGRGAAAPSNDVANRPAPPPRCPKNAPMQAQQAAC